MLEIGPGPGAATDWLRHRVKRLTAVEVDAEAAGTLADRFGGGNVEIVTGDATELAYPDESFDSVGSFTMLHHVPTAGAADPGSWPRPSGCSGPAACCIGSDSLASNDLHHFHEDDTYNPVDPAALLVRLQTLGFGKITMMVDWDLRFVAHKPAGQDACGDGPEPEAAA